MPRSDPFRRRTDENFRIIAVAVLIGGSSLALHVARAQLLETKRTDLQRHDLSVPGREVVQARVELTTDVVEKGKPLAVVVK